MAVIIPTPERYALDTRAYQTRYSYEQVVAAFSDLQAAIGEYSAAVGEADRALRAASGETTAMGIHVYALVNPIAGQLLALLENQPLATVDGSNTEIYPVAKAERLAKTNRSHASRIRRLLAKL